jgi:hypothetical protein
MDAVKRDDAINEKHVEVYGISLAATMTGL